MNTASDKMISRIQQNLRQIRLILNLTATEFAEYLGVTRQTVNNLEIGKSALGAIQVIAVLSVIEHRTGKHSRERHWIQELIGINPEEFGTDSLLECWFRINGRQEKEVNTESKLSSLYDNLTKNTAVCITMNQFVERNDKVYLFYDFLLRKECFAFFEKFTECISNRRKTLPLVVLKTHLQALLSLRTPETEYRIVRLYEKMNLLKEQGLLMTEDSDCMQADLFQDYDTICYRMQERNFFSSVLSESKELAENAKKSCPVYCLESFSGIMDVF